MSLSNPSPIAAKTEARGRLKFVRTPEGGFVTLSEDTVGLDILQTVLKRRCKAGIYI